MALTAIKTDGDEIEIIDQLLLPHTTRWIKIESTDDAYDAIKTMKIRGAPAIASLASLSIASLLAKAIKTEPVPPFLASVDALRAHLDPILDHLYSSRPTAVNLGQAVRRLRTILHDDDEDDGSADGTTQTPTQKQKQKQTGTTTTVHAIVERLIQEGHQVADEDVGRNRAMARNGAEWILEQVEKTQPGASAGGINVMTVCNTGSLATSGYGTALGVITHLYETGKLKRAFYTQSTPYHQGSRLTALELLSLGIPCTMLCDSMVGSLFQLHEIHAVVVGADRIALNGDTANKIGTYNAAVLAARHKIPFVVIAPVSTVDLATRDGSRIPIEHRPPLEACIVRGELVGASTAEDTQGVVQVTPDLDLTGGGVYNPSFDVTPASLISAIVTERGVAVREGSSAEAIEVTRVA